MSLGGVDEHAAARLARPRVLLAALYHRENFPLPRFPLGISDVARAARSTLMGTVELADMQLGVTLEDLLTLPSLAGAEVVHEPGHLHRIVTRASLLGSVPQPSHHLVCAEAGAVTAAESTGRDVVTELAARGCAARHDGPMTTP